MPAGTRIDSLSVSAGGPEWSESQSLVEIGHFEIKIGLVEDLTEKFKSLKSDRQRELDELELEVAQRKARIAERHETELRELKIRQAGDFDKLGLELATRRVEISGRYSPQFRELRKGLEAE